MKFKNEIIVAIALLVLTPSMVLAVDIDNMKKKECQYIVYGNGTVQYDIGANLIGIVEGIGYMIPKDKKTEFALKSTFGIIKHKACQNALNNISSDGFGHDFLWEASKLIDTRLKHIK